MSRYIDADKLKEHYMWWGGGFTANCKDGQKEVKKIFDEIIDLQPTADVRENVKACWQIGESNKQRRHAGMFCSNCGFEVCSADKGWNVYVDDHYHYCPNCGADMRGEA